MTDQELQDTMSDVNRIREKASEIIQSIPEDEFDISNKSSRNDIQVLAGAILCGMTQMDLPSFLVVVKASLISAYKIGCRDSVDVGSAFGEL